MAHLRDSLSLHDSQKERQAIRMFALTQEDFPGGLDSKASAYNAEDLGSIPGSGRSPGEENGNPL